MEPALEPNKDGSGWNIRGVPRRKEPDCEELATVVTPPYRFHSALDIDTSYGISAEEEVASSPRDFSFVTNCENYKTESGRLQIVLWPYSFNKQEVRQALAKLGTCALGTGRLWITDAKVSHASDSPDNKLGEIEWMRFTVEIKLPGLKAERMRPAANK